MNFLLDTNVVSEWARPAPDARVVTWLRQVDEDRTFLSVMTLGELGHGVERLPDGERKRRLGAWLSTALRERFGERILPIDPQIAQAWGVLMARADATGRPAGAMDGWLAATAMCHALTIVTRNTRDFSAFAVPLLDPWEA